MNILALDTSSSAASCAYMEDSNLIGEFFNNAKITHSQTILPMVDSMFDSCRRSIDDTDIFAVAVGPGSYTGLRIGISAIKGFAFSNSKLCAGVSTLEGLAYNVIFMPSIIVPVMDARRERVYTALFSSNGDKISRLHEDTTLHISELGELLQQIPNGRDAILIGDGALLCKNELADILPDLKTAPANLLHQRASSLCLAATEMAKSNLLISADELTPNYLILPQAQRELEENKLNL